MTNLMQGQKLLLLRYGNRPGCIEEHCEVLNQLGSCWFGKIGTVPAKKHLDDIYAEKHPALMLFSGRGVYLCQTDSYRYDRPDTAYPRYYDDELFGQPREPKIYFRLTDIIEADSELLHRLFVISSHNNVIETLSQSMASCFYIRYGTYAPSEKSRSTKETDHNSNSTYDKNSCMYATEGICQRKRFVNYGYPCERPSSCQGQKMKKTGA